MNTSLQPTGSYAPCNCTASAVLASMDLERDRTAQPLDQSTPSIV
jgi:hypothetical protein